MLTCSTTDCCSHNSCESFGHASLHIHPVHRFKVVRLVKRSHMTWIFFDNVHGRKLIHVCYFSLYNLYKDSCPLIGWIAFIILTIYRIRWQSILLHSVWVGKSAKTMYYCTHRFTFILECSVFPVQSLDICSKMRLIRKTTCKTLCGANVTGACVLCDANVRYSAWYFPLRVGHAACLMFCLS